MLKSRYLIIMLIAITTLTIELVWTRIFSAEFFYTFAFLILSLSVAGLGMGALANRLFLKISKLHISTVLLLSAICALIGPPSVFLIELEFSELFDNPIQMGKVFFAVLILSSSFFFAGIAIAKIFLEGKKDLFKLYTFDMVGAGLGCILALLAMNLFGTPVVAAFTGLPIALASMLIGKKVHQIFSIFTIIFMIGLSLFSESLLEKPLEEKAPVIYKHWDAMAKLKIYQYNEFYKGLVTDNTSGSTIIGFDGNFNRSENEKFDYGINITYLLAKTSPCTFLSVGAGGGMDVLQALFGGASEVHAVEVNPHINYLLQEGELSAFSGNIYNDPRVIVITEDARAYVKKFNKKFDIIFARNSNSYAALASGAFALAENYLFTTEAFVDYWNALSDDGYIIMDHQSYVPRMISSVIDALKLKGIHSPEKHIAVFESSEFHRLLILISKQTLNKQIIFFAFDELKYRNSNRLRLIYPPFEATESELVSKIIINGWENTVDEAAIDISPTTDDKPFIAQLGLWRNLQNANFEKVLPSDEFYGFPISQLLIFIVLVSTFIIFLPLNLIPYLQKNKKNNLSLSEWLLFFIIGIAYMGIEVVLIQKYTLFLGPSIYGLMTILSVMLISSGIGSKYSNRINFRNIIAMIVFFLIIDTFVYTAIISYFGGLSLIIRIIITIIMVFPLGFFIGMPFPKAGILIGDKIDWAFAVNGTASVLGSSMILLISFNFGFRIALLTAGILYLVTIFLQKQTIDTK